MSAQKKAGLELTEPGLDQLTEIVIREIGGKIGGKSLARLLRLFFPRQAREFASMLLALEAGLDSAQPWLAAQAAATALSGAVDLRGMERVPAAGPLLALANHPGMADGIAAFCSLPRTDVMVVAGRTPILSGLPNISSRLITLPENPSGGFTVLREVIAWLRKGGAVFYFPFGSLEPDPALIPGAANTIAAWSESVGVILSKAPETQLLPMLISGVLNPRAWQAAWLRVARSAKRRHQLAMVWQFIRYARNYDDRWKTTMRVDIGEPMPARSLSIGLDPTEINIEARAALMRLLAQEYPQDPGLLPTSEYLPPV